MCTAAPSCMTGSRHASPARRPSSPADPTLLPHTCPHLLQHPLPHTHRTPSPSNSWPPSCATVSWCTSPAPKLSQPDGTTLSVHTTFHITFNAPPQLATKLRNRLSTYQPGSEAEFETSVKAQAAVLVRQSFGQTMLHAIGHVYEQQADIALGGFFGGMGARLSATKEGMKNQ
eukprot:73753-Chlamydomonas_euryale.AAC.1